MINQYDYVAKFENYADEMPHVLDLINIRERLSGLAEIVPDHNQTEISSITDTFFSMLDIADVERLYEIYEEDFLLLNYTFRFKGLNFPP